jgi:lipoate-protein ligase A
MIEGLKLIGIKAEASFRKKRSSGDKNPACFKAVSYGEITVNGKKIIGSAQKRYKEGFLQHGSILMNFDSEELSRILGMNSSSTFDDIAAINDFAPGISFPDLITALKEAFEHTLKVKLISDIPSKLEQANAKELELGKYSTDKWNHSR